MAAKDGGMIGRYWSEASIKAMIKDEMGNTDGGRNIVGTVMHITLGAGTFNDIAYLPGDSFVEAVEEWQPGTPITARTYFSIYNPGPPFTVTNNDLLDLFNPIVIASRNFIRIKINGFNSGDLQTPTTTGNGPDFNKAFHNETHPFSEGEQGDLVQLGPDPSVRLILYGSTNVRIEEANTGERQFFTDQNMVALVPHRNQTVEVLGGGSTVWWCQE